jgi:osmotically-inducible protein OsmY
MKSSYLLAGLATAAALSGCRGEREDRRNDTQWQAQRAKEAEEEFRPDRTAAHPNANAPTGTEQAEQTFLQKLARQVDDLDGKIKELEARATSYTGGARESVEAAMGDLRSARTELDAELAMLRQATGRMWDSARVTVDRRLESLARAEAAARARLAGPADRPVVPDAALASTVEARLREDDLVARSSQIQVEARAGVVTLKGTVASQADRARALDLARTTEGVLTVTDQLTIKVRLPATAKTPGPGRG